MADMGIMVQAYQADNSIFATCTFINNIESSLQNIKFSGVRGHHQNGIAEHAIQSILSKARTILMHAAIRRPSMVETNVWPMAVDYAVYHHNHMPRPSVGMLAPIDLLLKIQSAQTHFHDMHVWGCPCYVLDPKLQDGHKLPKWKPRSRRGMFVGFSPRHSSLVPLVLNPQTGKISPQFHVVFDDWFTSVLSVGAEDAFKPSMWQTLFSHSHYYYMFDDHDAISLSDEWTDPGLQNVLDDHQHQLNRLPHRTGLLLQRETDNVSSSKLVDTPTLTPNPLPPLDPTLNPGGLPDATVPSQAWDPTPAVPSPAQDPTPAVPSPAWDPTSSFPSLNPPPSSSVRCSTCTRTAPICWGYDETHGAGYEAISSICAFVADADHAQVYSAFVAGDSSTKTYDYRDPLVYQASTCKDPDLPGYVEALMGPDHEGFYEGMRQEIKELESKNTWTPILRSKMQKHGRKALPSTWVFHHKRFPDGSIQKRKARLCVRGDKQVPGIDFTEFYSPVVQWTSIRLILILSLVLNWQTVQTDYTNAFTQSTLAEQVYMEIPKDFMTSDKNNDYILNSSKVCMDYDKPP